MPTPESEARPERIDHSVVVIRYRNHRGETADRRVVPRLLWFGKTWWHPEPQWLMDAYDIDRQVARSFALADVLSWKAGVPAPKEVNRD